MGFKSHRVPGSRVDPMGKPGWPGCCTGRSFDKPGLIQPPGRPARSPEVGRAVATTGLLLNPNRSSHRAGPGLITMVQTTHITNVCN